MCVLRRGGGQFFCPSSYVSRGISSFTWWRRNIACSTNDCAVDYSSFFSSKLLQCVYLPFLPHFFLEGEGMRKNILSAFTFLYSKTFFFSRCFPSERSTHERETVRALFSKQTRVVYLHIIFASRGGGKPAASCLLSSPSLGLASVSSAKA